MQQGGVACKAEGDYAVFLRLFASLRHCTESNLLLGEYKYSVVARTLQASGCKLACTRNERSRFSQKANGAVASRRPRPRGAELKSQDCATHRNRV